MPYAVTGTLTTYPPTTYPTVTEKVGTADIEYDNPCDNPFTFEATTQTNSPVTDNYSTNGQTFSLTPFTIDPPRCKVEYACTGVTGPLNTNGVVGLSCSDLPFDGVFDGADDSNGNSDGEMTVVVSKDKYLNGTVPPGDYVVTIQGTATKSGQTQDTQVTIKVVDPCDPPTSLTANNMDNQSYVITDDRTAPFNTYTHPDFDISPDYC